MPIVILKCSVCNEHFDGTNGYAFYKGKGLCPKCKLKLKGENNEEKDENQKEKA